MIVIRSVVMGGEYGGGDVFADCGDAGGDIIWCQATYYHCWSQWSQWTLVVMKGNAKDLRVVAGGACVPPTEPPIKKSPPPPDPILLAPLLRATALFSKWM